MALSGCKSCRADEIIRQDGRLKFAIYHLGRFATDVAEIQDRLDAPDIELNLPAKSVKFGDVFFRVLFLVKQRRDDVDRRSTATWLDNVESNFPQHKLMPNHEGRSFVLPKARAQRAIYDHTQR